MILDSSGTGTVGSTATNRSIGSSSPGSSVGGVRVTISITVAVTVTGTVTMMPVPLWWTI